ncbi:hypothetical protein N7456_000356 [Penicillium angulare]|uniref:Uncharacterized protein n=1 Tax=Penicillium angulare TaxID=116970 RepID=A0A9W9GBV0_9EURO|nr:hypothetical protein N7456_000356 [Penicillium angulare]
MAARTHSFRALWQSCAGPSTRNTYQTIPTSSWRTFVTSAPRTARGPAKPSPRTPPKSSAAQPRIPAGSIGRLALKVAKEGDVVLYQSRSHRTFIISAYGLSAFCFAYAAFNGYDVLGDSKFDRPVWQKAMFGGICVMMSAMGTVILARTGNLVNTITAIKSSSNQTKIRLNVRHAVPFMKPMQFEALPSDIYIHRRLVVSEQSRARFESDRLKLGSVDEASPQPFSMMAPARAMSQGIWRLFMCMRQVFTQEDTILLGIKTPKLRVVRVDSNGSLSEDFLALGNPVKNVRALGNEGSSS